MTARLFTRFELTPWGFVGLICRMQPDGILAGRYVNACGSRRTVRRALRAELLKAPRPQAAAASPAAA
jgi:hypothetical protein